MELNGNKFYVVSIGDNKTVESDKVSAIKVLAGLVKKVEGDLEELNPEIIEVDTTEEKWQLKGLSWNTIAFEIMRLNK